MKYNQYLKALEQDAPPQWRGKFLKYKELKKLLKGVKVPREVLLPDGKGTETRLVCNTYRQKVFLEAVQKDVAFVNGEFESAARELIDGRGRQSCFAALAAALARLFRRPQEGSREDRRARERERADEAEWCRRYAEINAISLRKILKKHDKRCGCKLGYDLLQDFWTGERRDSAAFLHSPLLEELRSLADLCRRQAEAASPEPGGRGGPEASAAYPHDSSRMPPAVTSETQGYIRVDVSPSHAAGEGGAGDATREWVELPMLPSLHPGRLEEIVEDEGEHEQNDQNGGQQQDAGGREAPAHAAPPPASSAGAALKADPPGAGGGQGLHADLRSLSVQSIESSHLDEAEVDLEHTCPICLEVLYQPIGLDCGHRFCADCAFSASGKMHALGTVKAILDHIDPAAPCPECRTPGVFRGAHQLRETAKLLRQRYPSQWAEKERDFQAKQARLRELLAAQRAAEGPRSHSLVDRMRNLLDPNSN